MNDADFSKLDTHLYDLVINHFQIDLTVQKNLDTYHVFRNDLVELIDDEEIGKSWVGFLISLEKRKKIKT